ncbi:40827_t:CDS:2 [Gigaspora margarita]|uniref:40827_t:CDS:1 n=1 Tax=Gigaspora margarita TaxID=4874 RepID=A0ABN7V900_GIGMA|nr:40827_t:CDS:2 [Gigaspora margarita]
MVKSPFIDPRILENQNHQYDKQSESIGAPIWQKRGRYKRFPTMIIRGSRDAPYNILLFTKCWDNETNKRPSMTQKFSTIEFFRI